MSGERDSRGDPTDGCGVAPVREQLERILESPTFAASPQLRAFLTYVVDRRLDGAAGQIKGYTIAVEALGRDASFDPASDPIVRVEAARLRRVLGEYYDGPGAADPVIIDIPKGGYVPRFLPGSADAAAGSGPVSPRPPPSLAAPAQRRPGRLVAVAGLTAVAILAAGATGYLLQRGPGGEPAPTVAVASSPGLAEAPLYKGELPVVHVAAIAHDPADAVPADFPLSELRQKVETALARFDEVGVADSGDAADYRLDGRLTEDEGRFFLNFRLIYGGDREVIWSSLIDVARADEPAELVQERIARNVATAIAQPYGVIFSHAASRGGGAPGPEGLRCVVQTFNAQRRFSADLNARSRACLAGLARDQAAPVAVHALLPLAYIDDVRSGDDPARRAAALTEALGLAERAVELAPASGRAHQALESVLLLAGRPQEAVAAGRRALEINPNDPDILATHGGALVMAGESADGLDLLRRAIRANPDHPDWYATMAVFGALAENDTALADRYADRLNRSPALSSRLARLLVAHERGDAAAAQALRQGLLRDRPALAGDPDAALAAALPSPALRARLLQALAADGAPAPR